MNIKIRRRREIVRCRRLATRHVNGPWHRARPCLLTDNKINDGQNKVCSEVVGRKCRV
jgi:hypothetical protein